MFQQGKDNFITQMAKLKLFEQVGQVAAISPLSIEAVGLEKNCAIGAHCVVESMPRNASREPHNNKNSASAVSLKQDANLHGAADAQTSVIAEVVAMRGDRAILLPFSHSGGVTLGNSVRLQNSHGFAVYPHHSWLGRVVNGFGEAIDRQGPLLKGNMAYPMHNMPPAPHARRRLHAKLDLGIRALNAFLPCCKGQRMGIFAGSGVGKSMMMAMMAKYSAAQVNIIGLIGERGREVQEFLQDYLGKEGLARSIVVVATSDESSLTKRQAAYLTISLGEYFRDQGLDVLCMLDSVTRFAMAVREIGMAVGEMPTSKGYTASVFNELPRLLERAGPGAGTQGDITLLASVLVEGDDHNEPVADTVRGILDGHIILTREIAERGIYPAIDVLKSVSRVLPRCNSPEENAILQRARRMLAAYYDMQDMIRIGAYVHGSDPRIDEALRHIDALHAFIGQNYNEHDDIAQSYAKLARACGN